MSDLLTPTEKVLLAVDTARRRGFDKTIYDYDVCMVVHDDDCPACDDVCNGSVICTCDMSVVLQSFDQAVMILSDGQVLREQ